MSKFRHIIPCMGLFLGLFFLSFSLSAEGGLSSKSSSTTFDITGGNVFCEGENSTTTLTVQVPTYLPFNKKYVWNGVDGTASITVTPTADTTFFVEVYDATEDTLLGVAQKTIYITTRPTATRVNDTLCPGLDREAIVGMRNTTAKYFLWFPDPDNLSYNAPYNQWNPPPTTDSINIWTPVHPPPAQVTRSKFFVQMSTHPMTEYGFENHCWATDSAFVEVDDARFELVGDTTICEGSTTTLMIVGNTSGDILWRNVADSVLAVNIDSITVEIPDVGLFSFFLEAEDYRGCPATKEIVVRGLAVPSGVYILPDTGMICRGSSTFLTAISDNGESYLWSHANETTPYIEVFPRQRTEYKVTVFGGPNLTGCHANSDAIAINVENCDLIYFPTAIRLSSPNPVNRIFKPIGVPHDYTQYYFAVFDRWGQLIFESRNLDLGWDGTHQNQNVRPGVYGFVFRLNNKGDVWERIGTITVID